MMLSRLNSSRSKLNNKMPVATECGNTTRCSEQAPPCKSPQGATPRLRSPLAIKMPITSPLISPINSPLCSPTTSQASSVPPIIRDCDRRKAGKDGKLMAVKKAGKRPPVYAVPPAAIPRAVSPVPPAAVPRAISPAAVAVPSAAKPVVSKPAVPTVTIDKHPVPAKPEHAAMEAFVFLEPPSPTSKANAASAPPLGTPAHAWRDPKERDPQRVLARFGPLMQCMVDLSKNAATERRGELLPCLPLHDAVKQIARRINFLSDAGAGMMDEFQEVWRDIVKVITTIFGSRLGRGVRQSGITDILGCLYDVEIMHNQMPVPVDSVHDCVNAVYKYCDPPSAFTSLSSMLRFQHTGSADMNDETSVGMVIDGMLRVSTRAGEVPQRDCAPMLYEIQRWCGVGDDGIDVFAKLEQGGASIRDQHGVLSAVRTAACNIQLACGVGATNLALREFPADLGRERLMQMLCNASTPVPSRGGEDTEDQTGLAAMTMTA